MTGESFSELGLLFVSAFVSSTLAPGGSEAMLAWLLIHSNTDHWWLWSSATAGNTLGAMTTWGLGFLASRGWSVDKFSRTATSGRALARVRRYGTSALLLSWLPVVGDGLCLAAGWLNLPWRLGLLMIALGKGLRYGALLWWLG